MNCLDAQIRRGLKERECLIIAADSMLRKMSPAEKVTIILTVAISRDKSLLRPTCHLTVA